MLRANAITADFSLSRLTPTTRCLIFLFVTLFFYKAVSNLLYGPYVHAGSRLLPYTIVLVIAIGGIGVSFAQATVPLRILLRSISAFVLFYIVTSYVSVPESMLGGSALTDFELNKAWLIAAAFGVGAFFRPSLGIVPLHFIPWQKNRWSNVFELDIDWLDHFTLIETGTYLILGFLLFVALKRVFAFDDDRATGGLSSAINRGAVAPHPLHMVVLLAIALHFGNYFYAGLIKAALGAHPLDWVLRNETHYLVLAALQSDVLPISFSQTLTGWTFHGLEKLHVLTNFMTFAIQLFALFAIVRVKWAIWTTLSYDLLHLIIFVTTGIFFWKFIILNLAIVAALTPLRSMVIPRRLTMLLIVMVAFSPFFFRIMPSFAWLDTRSMNDVRYVAVTKSGEEVPVPSNYFLGMSVTFAQDRMVWPNDGVFPTWTWGTTRDLDQMEPGLACQLPLTTPHDRQFYFVPREHIAGVIRRHHQLIMAHVDGDGLFDYDLFPHHIFSVPWRSTAFKQLDKREIVAYRYISESMCLDYKDGELKVDRKSIHTFDIPVQR